MSIWLWLMIIVVILVLGIGYLLEKHTPEGYEDEDTGFHYGEKPKGKT